MFLKDVIDALEKEDPNKVLPVGFYCPHSYRGYYERLAFEPIRNIPVGVVLEQAKSAVGATYQGYKGGLFKMDSWTEVYIAEYGNCGDELSHAMLSVMLGRPIEEYYKSESVPEWAALTESDKKWMESRAIPEDKIHLYE